ncbi:MAG: DUF1015 family protein [Candidatus Binatia bacterium]
MAIVMPFRGIHYDPRNVGDIGEVVTAPYDVISAEEQELCYQRSEHNIIRLILGKVYPKDDDTNNRYTRAAGFLNAWLREGVLVQDPQPAFYLYRQAYTLEGKERVGRGIIGLVRLDEFRRGVILPHEKTLTAPKADRLALLGACQANLSPIFGLYSDPEKGLTSLFMEKEVQDSPRYRLVDDRGIHHALWPLFQQEAIERIASRIENKKILIADGHHRYETALQFQKKMRGGMTEDIGKKPFDYVLMYLANMDEEGFSILPTHRLVRRVPDLDSGGLPSLLERINHRFDILELPFVPETEEEARQLAAEGRAIVWIDGGLHATEVAHGQHSPLLAYTIVEGPAELYEGTAPEGSCLRSLRRGRPLLLVDPQGGRLASGSPLERFA